MIVKEYIEEFYRLEIKSRHVDDDVEKIARFVNGLRYGIQDEISFLKLESVENYINMPSNYKEVEVEDSREEKVDLMEKMEDLTIVYKTRENLSRQMMTKERLNGKVVILTEEVTILIEEEVILILEVVFMQIILEVVKRDIDHLNLDPLKVGMVIEML